MEFLKINYPIGFYSLSTNYSNYGTYYWAKILRDIVEKHRSDDDFKMSDYIVPVEAFHETSFSFTEIVDKNDMAEVVIHDYENITEKKVIWYASVEEIAGHRILLRYIGFNGERKEVWMHVASTDIEYLDKHPVAEVIIAPPRCMLGQIESVEDMRRARDVHIGAMDNENYGALNNFLNKTLFLPTLDDRKFRKGQRIELLDTNKSTRVRPARIQEVIGRRIYVRIEERDCKKSNADKNDRQFADASFWIDQDSFLIFHVGWAAHNKYGYTATREYRQHAERIAKALRNLPFVKPLFHGENPLWDDDDVTPEMIHEESENDKNTEWEAGMKFELLDPLSEVFQSFHIASVKKLLEGGYMVVEMDGGKADESFPIHITSKFLFRAGYAHDHFIHLEYPEEMANFSWETYLKETNSIAADAHLFTTEDLPEQLDMFKNGAKLEATDLCGNHAIYVATVVMKLGRLLCISYDGWNMDSNALVDVESHEIFPVGYAELFGYALEIPKEVSDNGLLE